MLRWQINNVLRCNVTGPSPSTTDTVTATAAKEGCAAVLRAAQGASLVEAGS